EQAENNKALEICLQQIDECRPFFVGLLGERYGWIPQKFSEQMLNRYDWLRLFSHRSVTELEMIYGALNGFYPRSRAFFFFRDSAVLNDIPEEVRLAVYAESGPEQIRKLADLKDRIRRSGHWVMERYPACWDDNANNISTQSTGRIVGLEVFGERVTEQLWQAIKAEF